MNVTCRPIKNPTEKQKSYLFIKGKHLNHIYLQLIPFQ